MQLFVRCGGVGTLTVECQPGDTAQHLLERLTRKSPLLGHPDELVSQPGPHLYSPSCQGCMPAAFNTHLYSPHSKYVDVSAKMRAQDLSSPCDINRGIRSFNNQTSCISPCIHILTSPHHLTLLTFSASILRRPAAVRRSPGAPSIPLWTSYHTCLHPPACWQASWRRRGWWVHWGRI